MGYTEDKAPKADRTEIVFTVPSGPKDGVSCFVRMPEGKKDEEEIIQRVLSPMFEALHRNLFCFTRTHLFAVIFWRGIKDSIYVNACLITMMNQKYGENQEIVCKVTKLVEEVPDYKKEEYVHKGIKYGTVTKEGIIYAWNFHSKEEKKHSCLYIALDEISKFYDDEYLKSCVLEHFSEKGITEVDLIHYKAKTLDVKAELDALDDFILENFPDFLKGCPTV